MLVVLIVSIGLPKADDTWTRLAMRTMSLVRLSPAAWKSAWLKKRPSPRPSGTCTKWSAK